MIVMVVALEAELPEASVTAIVKLKSPAEVGTPENCGLDMTSPSGSFPAVIAKAYGATPPLAVRICSG